MLLQKALMCLALNVYHESRGEPFDGQVAVAMVTMNRADWQTADVCRVVYEHKQFSWTHKARNHTPRESAAWVRAQRVARAVMDRRHADRTGGATHFHARSVRPVWLNSLKKTTTIGRHVFYAQY